MSKFEIPGIKEVAKALGLKPPDESKIGIPTLCAPSGVKIEVRKEGRGYVYFSRVVVVIETNNYPATRRKVRLYSGSVSYNHDTVVSRSLTKDEIRKVKEKYVEMCRAQKCIDERNMRLEAARNDKDRDRELLEKAIKKAGIDVFGDDDVPELSLCTHNRKMTLDLSDKTPEQIVNIHAAIKKTMQEQG